jgi:hypothetical protein
MVVNDSGGKIYLNLSFDHTGGVAPQYGYISKKSF